jgi:uncharacterized protein (DUF2147 family)
MNRIIVWAAGLAAALAAFTHAAHAAGDPVFSDWLTEAGGAKVRIAACAANPAQACGTIVWLKAANDVAGKPQRDVANPSPALRTRPMLGLPMLADFHREAPGQWTDGKIYDPNEGRTYRSKMALAANGTLKVSGCVLVFCQSQTWTKVELRGLTPG